MASFTALQSSFFFSSTPNLHSFSSGFPFFAPKRIIQEPFPNLGCCCKKREGFAMDGSYDKLEDEIYEFMQRSKNPNDFPRREELIEAGRADLAEAIARKGGWFTFGWNLEEEEDVGRSTEKKVGGKEEMGIEGILSRLEKERSFAYGVGSIEKKRLNGKRSWRNVGLDRQDDVLVADNRLVSSIDRSSRSVTSDMDEKLFHNLGGSHSRKGTSADNNSVTTMPMWRIWSLQRAGNHTSNFEADEIVPSAKRSVNHNFNMDVSVNENAVVLPNERSVDHNFSGDVTVDENMNALPNEKRSANHNFNGDVSDDGNTLVLQNEERSINHNFIGGVSKDENVVAQSGEQSKGSVRDTEEICQNQIHLHLKHMETELTSSLRSLRSRSKGVVSYKDQESLLAQLHRLCDELEFKQTEIMNAKDKLRSIRAKLAVLRGKMTHVIIEEQKIMDIRKKKLDAAQKALDLLRSVCIVWPNSASEVLLAGSFDGWSNKRRMDRSKEGIFTLYLRLYPGRYEIKFIVDGMWMIDPSRPTVWNNGHQNNLLLVT